MEVVDVKGSVAELEGEKVHCLESVKEGESYNRREAFRVRLGVEHTITKLIPREKEEEESSEKDMNTDILDEDYEFITLPCVIKDLSETGVGIYTNDKMDIGTLLELRIPTKRAYLRCQEALSVQKAESLESTGSFMAAASAV